VRETASPNRHFGVLWVILYREYDDDYKKSSVFEARIECIPELR